MKPWIKQIRALMLERGMTQETLANHLGRGQSWVNHKLSGRRKANVEDIVLIAQALGIEPAVLLSNVTNYDRLADNFLGTSEPAAKYEYGTLTDLQRKLSLLDKKDAQRFLKDTHSNLDTLINTKQP